MTALLEVDRLVVSAGASKREFDLVEELSLEVQSDQITALVGESGCGKSITSLAIMGLLPASARIRSGEIRFAGSRIESLGESEYCRLRGREIGMIFQEPMTSLNPLMKVGDQIAESFRIHAGCGRREAWDRAIEMLARVKISDPARRALQYPHQMSGGMRQRMMIAIALAPSPRLLLADEPTTALDVTIQAQILELINELMEDRRKRGEPMGVLLITHDMGVVAECADHIVVMYAGREVESGTVKDLFASPRHPYTKGLFDAIPQLTPSDLKAIPGVVPKPGMRPKHCAFADRCPRVFDECRTGPIPLFNHGGVKVRCLLDRSA